MFSKAILIVSIFFLAMILPNDEVIIWNEDVKLSWKDFRAVPNENREEAALTASGITFEFSVKETNNTIVDFNAKVLAHFYPDKSWYVKDRSNDHILNHEQVHFDITELHVRKFRKRIDRLKVNDQIKKELRSLHQTINTELAVMQAKYDLETDHSIKKDSQEQWNQYIQEELIKLDTYKSKN